MSKRTFRLLCGDVADLATLLPPGSFDACLCDPPYGLGFMGKAWDHGVPGAATWKALSAALKPGAMLLAFGGTRTFHRLACAIEDAGFEIRDTLCWLYGSGFPKSLDVSKAIDKAAGAERQHVADRPAHTASAKWREAEGRADRLNPPPVTAPLSADGIRWSGYGTALKPAWEPIVLAMKPLDGTFAENALEHGVAGLDIDGCRLPVADEAYARNCSGDHGHAGTRDGGEATSMRMGGGAASSGRWPANVVLDEEAAALLDEQSGELTSGANPTRRGSDKFRNSYGDFEGQRECVARRGTDSGGASRFFYCAKVSTAERGGSSHPTLKPLNLTAWLARLILPPARETPRRLLVPFSGAGSEVIGALAAGWDEVVGIEQSADYIAQARARIRGAGPLLYQEEPAA